MTRVEFFDRYLTGHFRANTEGSFRAIAALFDATIPEFNQVQLLVNQLNESYRAKDILDYPTYTTLYNMVIGMAYDEDGDPYITNEDYTDGLVDIWINPDQVKYQGDFGDFSFMASGTGGMSYIIREAVKLAVEAQGGTVLSIDIKETVTQKLWNLPLSANYAVRVFYHGSPLIVAIIVGISIALVAVGVMLVVWRMTAVQLAKETTKQIQATEEMNAGLLAIAQNPNLPASIRQAAIDAVAKSQIAIAQGLGVPKADPLSGISGIIKWSAIGLGLVLAYQVVSNLNLGKKQ